MKCRECVFMDDFGEGYYRCTNHDSVNYMTETGLCCEDECDDGKYFADPKPEREANEDY